jgi:hypothetical protein
MKISIVLSLSFCIILIVVMNKVFAISSISLHLEAPTSDREAKTLSWIKNLPSDMLLIDKSSAASTESNMMLSNPALNKMGSKDSANTLDAIVSYINQTFKLKYSIALVIGSGRVAYSDSEEKIIFMPFTFFEDARAHFTQAGKGALIESAVSDAFFHTVLHELGHLLIDMYDMPIVGREEDAVDALATALMIKSFTNGASRVEHIAQLYGHEREQIKNLRKWDFMGEHSLNIQRHYQMMCHVYGSDPEHYQKLKSRIGFTDDRARICIDEYQQISRGWSQLLQPYLLNL